MMQIFFRKTGEYRFRFLATLVVFFLLLGAAVRGVLLLGFSWALPPSSDAISGLMKGLVNDSAALAFVLLLPATLILLPTDKFLNRKRGKYFALSILFVFAGIFIFSAISEYFFWDEFDCRFNFIAVDYLIYTTEVVQNLIESYPLGWLLSLVFVLAAGFAALAWKELKRHLPKLKTVPWEYVPNNGSLGGRLGFLSTLYALAAILFFFFTPLSGSQDRYWNEFAKNGTYQLFSAYLHNQLDYRAFYKTMDNRDAFRLVQNEIRDANKAFVPMKEASLARWTEKTGEPIKPNVIIVLMESMGKKWLGEEYTPNLQAIAEQGLTFTNMMSTGTRTVRGIEALMLSVPPTPGNSIVRRPDSDLLFTFGSPFRENGYDLDFVYGGIGYFDNMNGFFSSNLYTVTDKLDFSPQSSTFSNAWGQCDEDLYAESLRLADRSHESGKPFQQVLLTTSNHRPFTFPDGKIDMEPGSRRAAVKYTDYAVGEFLKQARGKPWFDNTIFVFVGDHPSSIAGKTEVPPDAYGIVCIMYGPKFFKPETVDTVCSQIDVGPTLLSSLGWEYRSVFFGTNARDLRPEEGRAWISTYQLLGFRTNDSLVVLKPDGSFDISRKGESGEWEPDSSLQKDPAIVARAVASYQCAYDQFTQKKMKASAVASYWPLLRSARSLAEKEAHPREEDQKPDARMLGLLLLESSARTHR